MMKRLGLLLFLLVASPFTSLAQGDVQLLDLGGDSRLSIEAISADGTTVVGAYIVQGRVEPFRWSESEGYTFLGYLPNGTWGTATDVSADGSVVVGYINVNDHQKSYRWTQASGMVEIPTFQNRPDMMATSVSWDGNVVVGDAGQAVFRWTPAGGTGNLSVLGSRVSASADGNHLAGQLFFWSNTDGYTSLSPAPGGGSLTTVIGISGDGSTVFGHAEGTFSFAPAYWTRETGVQYIGNGDLSGSITDMTVDGRTAIGSIHSSREVYPFIWNATTGLDSLRGYLPTSLYRIFYVEGISANGNVIVGNAVGTNDNRSVGVIIRLAPTYPIRTLSGTVTLQGSIEQSQLVTFEFQSADGANNFTRTVKTNSDRSFALYGIPANLYTVRIKGSKWLSRRIAVNATNSSVTDLQARLLAGDSNNDDSVDIFDLLVLINAYNTEIEQSHYSNLADLNNDDVVDISDLLLLIVNYNSMGE